MKYNVFFLISIFCVSCSSKLDKKVLKGKAFGTTYTIQYYGDISTEKTRIDLDAIIYSVNESMSTYLPQSDISKINAGDSTIITDTMFQEVFMLSRKVNQQSYGYFDPTVGVLRNAYGFGDVQPLTQIDTTVLDSLMQYVGWEKVALLKDGRIRKHREEIYFDFNAIAKGYGIDQIAAYLDQQQIEDYLIELGGEISAKGINKGKEQAWIVGIENIDSPLEGRSYGATLYLENRAMAASGNYRKTRIDTISGKRYVHTINPLTGSAERSDVLSASVLASTCAEADAWATAFMAMGLERSKRVLSNLKHVEAYLIYQDTLQKSQAIYATVGFKEVLR